MSTLAPPPGWERLPLSDAAEDCYADRFTVEAGLVLVRSRYRPRHDLIETSANPDGPRTLVITLGVQGESKYQGRDGASLGFRAGYTTVSSFRHAVGERHYRGASLVEQLRLLVDEHVLARYLGAERAEALLPRARVRALAFRPTTPACTARAGALMHDATAQATDPLNLHIHALSLLAEQLREFRAAATAPRRLSQGDIAKLEQVRDLMQAQMDRPLTLDYLCAAVGLSEFKLKQGCRYRFNTSPHRMLLELRMQRAWALLEGGCQVAQAGWQVGYRHPGNFSAAFTRFFGRTPKSVTGARG